MAWEFPDGTAYDGEVHVIGAHVFSGKTHTVSSRRLLKVADSVVSLQKSKSGKKVRKRRTRAEIQADKLNEALAKKMLDE